MTQLKHYIARVEAINDSSSITKEELKDIFDAAKKDGFNVVIMKKLIANRKKGRYKVAQEQELLEEYEALLGGQ
jgi:uncharacterized protein (UPF0335 family)